MSDASSSDGEEHISVSAEGWPSDPSGVIYVANCPDCGTRHSSGGRQHTEDAARSCCQTPVATDGGTDRLGDEVEQKEEHRLGTINRWDPPEGDWAAEHDWTRYRGPDPWPVPGGWVFKSPEEGGWWQYFGDMGVGHHSDDSILEELKEDDSVDDPYDALDDTRAEYASVTIETANPDEVSLRNPEDEKLEWELTVAGVQVFRRVEPDRPDLMAAVAEALAAFHAGDLEERADEIVPETGEKPEDVLEEEDLERRKDENESLDEFVTDGGDQIQCVLCDETSETVEDHNQHMEDIHGC